MVERLKFWDIEVGVVTVDDDDDDIGEVGVILSLSVAAAAFVDCYLENNINIRKGFNNDNDNLLWCLFTHKHTHIHNSMGIHWSRKIIVGGWCKIRERGKENIPQRIIIKILNQFFLSDDLFLVFQYNQTYPSAYIKAKGTQIKRDK